MSSKKVVQIRPQVPKSGVTYWYHIWRISEVIPQNEALYHFLDDMWRNLKPCIHFKLYGYG